MKYIIATIRDFESTPKFFFENPNKKKIVDNEPALFTKPGIGWSLDKGFFENDSKSYELVFGFSEVQDASQFCSVNEENNKVENRKKIYFLISQWMRDNKK